MGIRVSKKLKRMLLIFVLIVAIFSAIGFVEKQQSERVCNKIIVQIENQADNYFINEQDIIALVTEAGRNHAVGRNIDLIPLKEIEIRIKLNKYIDEAEVYRDLTGNLIVKARQSHPIARIIQETGPDAYIDKIGKILPVSDRFTARVLLIGGEYTSRLVKKDLTKSEEGLDILNLIHYIIADEFWKAQISEMYIDKKGEITMYPQISKQTIAFGKAVDIEAKFKKLKILYKEILPQKGWDIYETVNLKYHNQIVCE
ncbi:MAG: cell division protein FtsQ [Bacteroidota bacterium]|nr:cell division protein FtsQ [Bacteroidota bacterium]